MSGSDWNMQDRVLPHTRERREVDRRAGEGWDAWGGDHFLGQSGFPMGQHGYLADGSWRMGKPTEEWRITDVFERRQPRRHLPASRCLPVPVFALHVKKNRAGRDWVKMTCLEPTRMVLPLWAWQEIWTREEMSSLKMEKILLL